ncbi:MAG TPA: hypothetical protein VHT03_04750 [Rhizomicrobium sp.]|jgi:hypothetical protein|nr:hypothetical protein [Rhizomicrobium sp.]
MASREQHGNREKKKPKKEKPKTAPATTTSPFGEQRNQKPQPGKK